MASPHWWDTTLPWAKCSVTSMTWHMHIYIHIYIYPILKLSFLINILRPRKNGSHFPDGSFKCIYLNENVWISITISLKFVPNGPIDNIEALVQIMAWRRPGDKPLSEPMMVRLSTHICVTWPQWVKSISGIPFWTPHHKGNQQQ